MKLNEKQIDNIARCLGNIGVAAAIGAVVGFAGHSPKPLTAIEEIWLSISAVICFGGMVFIGRSKGK